MDPASTAPAAAATPRLPQQPQDQSEISRPRAQAPRGRPDRAGLRLFDGPKTCFYVDPPYPAGTRSRQWNRSAYQFEMRDHQHVHLLNLLRTVAGRVVLSCYESGLYDHMLKGWDKVEIPNRNQRCKISTEVLWIKP